MSHIWQIIQGWWKFLFFKRSELAKERLKICFQCPFRKIVFCGVCGCELHAKAELEDEECPKGYWIK